MSRHPDSSRHVRRSSKGFTLVEVLVAVTLLTTALVPAFVLSSNAIRLSLRIRNELIASGLAQEGVEIVRALRDANWFGPDGTSFDAGLTDCGSGCTFQFDSEGPESDDPTKKLKLDPDTGLYRYDRGDDTIFSREVTIEEGSTPSELIVSSVVEWEERGVEEPKSVIVEYHLFDWVK